MDSKKTGAVKYWFQQLLKIKLGINAVDGWAPLYKRHIPTITHLLTKGEFRLCEERLSEDSYLKAYKALKDQAIDASFLEHLKPDLAATGDNFEVAKFLIILLNELRISREAVFEEDYGLTDDQNAQIKSILHYLEDQENWDSYESWPAVLFESDNESCKSHNFSTPKLWSADFSYENLKLFKIHWRNREIAVSEISSTKRSPLSDIISSPRSRELRIIRDKDRKIKVLSDRCNLLEYERDNMESCLRTAEQEIVKLAKSLNEESNVINEKDARCQILNTELDEWRIKASAFEEKNNQLEQQLKTTKQELYTTQRQLREAEFDISSKQRTADSWKKSAALEEQWRLKMEREREELLQELETLQISKVAGEEKLRQLKADNEAEVFELQNMIDGLRSEIREMRREKDEVLISQSDRIRDKECEIASVIAGMQKQLRAAEISNAGIQSVALEIKNFAGEIENRKAEIQSIRLLFPSIQREYQTLLEENMQDKALIKSLQNHISISEYQSKALSASLEDQRKKHLEAMTAKQEILNEKQKMLLKLCNQLQNSSEFSLHLQEELKQRNAAYHVLEQRLASTEERCSTLSQRFSLSCSTLNCSKAEETIKLGTHFSDLLHEHWKIADVSSGAFLHEYHPLPKVEDENDLMSSSSVNGDLYLLKVEPQCYNSIAANEREEYSTSVDSERIVELNRRNKTLPPHMRSSYATELTYASNRFSSKNFEDALKNSENLGVFLCKDNSESPSAPSPSNLSRSKYASRSLRSVRKQFKKMLQEARMPKERTPLKMKNWKEIDL
ncbi:unnamed protein product [Thelazia callipaeda]|uniref:Chromosome partition protein Smc n=1 Tax=Thelazia callipaeda TaxID=103827 RepID=A0A0N5CN25_THECL|nr:unnamed protein product [Thelazia callipaeda]